MMHEDNDDTYRMLGLYLSGVTHEEFEPFGLHQQGFWEEVSL